MAISFIRGSARGLRATLLALMLMCVAGAIATTGLPATTLCHVSIGSVRQAATLPDHCTVSRWELHCRCSFTSRRRRIKYESELMLGFYCQ